VSRRTAKPHLALILSASIAISCAVGVGAGWLGVRLGCLPDPTPRSLVINGREIPDPLATPPERYAWTAQPDPAFPVPPYARFLRDLTIVVDPGHVGQTEKNRAANWKRGPTGLREAEANLRVAQFLKEFLDAASAKVIMTRERDAARDIDDDDDLAERARLANDAQADLLISIHHNGAASAEANYTTVFYHADGASNPASLSAARHILTGLNDALRLEKLTEIPLWSDLTIYPRGGFGLLRRAEVPAVLCESSFHTNPEEESRLRDPVYNRREAYGMFLGLARWAQAGLPRVALDEPRSGKVSRGKTVMVQLDDGLSKRDGKGPRALRVMAGSLRIELNGKPLDYLSLNQQKGELTIAIPSDVPKRSTTLFVDFQNIFGQHVTHPRIQLQIE
jgi:N-acetylmuramoyl-L-alanine amidase